MSDGDNNNIYDVGIFGWWYNGNYGANLSYYSLNKAVQKLGYSVLMLWRSRASKSMPDNVPIRFAKKHYNISAIYPKNELKKFNENCDVFLLGSDQLWNPDLQSVAGEEFFFSFVRDEKVKLAYAQSFGNYEKTGGAYNKKYLKYIKRFDKVSVREDFAEKLCKNEFGIDAPQLCDPVFLSEKKEYSELENDADVETPERYVANFILDPDDDRLEACKHVREKLGISDYVNLTDLDKANEKKEKFAGEDVLAGISIENFIKVYNNAEYIVTDSFHGTCLAIILNKPFISIANRKRGLKRFESVLGWLGLEDRLFYDAKDVKGIIPDYDVDYDKVNEIIAAGRDEGLEWLRTGIEKTIPITRKLDKSLCVGCGACVCRCPGEALALKTDKHGYYRAVLDEDKCIKCKKCVEVCPAYNNLLKTSSANPMCYAVAAKDEELLKESSSGGLFTLLAEQILEQGGKVYGAAWRDDWSVHHISVSSSKDLHLLRKSKYMQSYMGKVFGEVKNDLESDTKVLFSGTPCQIAGLKSFLGKENDNLITVDLLCGNSPSALFFKKYLEDSFEDGVKDYQFRYKSDDWKYFWRSDSICATDTYDNKIIQAGPKQDNYQRVYHNHTMCPKYCENCKYQEIPRYGDITIGDFWGIENYDMNKEHKKGVSAVLLNNDKGEKLFNSINEERFGYRKRMSADNLGGNGFTKGQKNFVSPGRKLFYEAITKMPFSDAVNYALKPNHGEYREIYDESFYVLSYDNRQLHFSFEEDFWEEHYIKGNTFLYSKKEKAGAGHYATINLSKALNKKQEYTLKARFKIKTRSKTLNLHVKDSGSKLFQIIKICDLKDKSDGEEWFEVECNFIPDCDFYDEFMIAASQVSGPDGFIQFDYINISMVY